MALVLAAVSAFLQAFGGSWTCHDGRYQVPWQISAAPGSAWTIVRWGDQSNQDGGVAYVGYVEKLGHWVYRDFHYDGSYSDIIADRTSDTADNGQTWHFSGPYYRAGAEFNGDIQWNVKGDRIDRVFSSLKDGKLTPSGSDFCVRSAAAPHPQ